MERFVRVTIGAKAGCENDALKDNRFALKQAVYVEAGGNVSAPLKYTSASILEDYIIFGDRQQLQFRVTWRSIEEDASTFEDGEEEDRKYIECYKADVETIEYVNRFPFDVLIKEGENCFRLLPPGGTLRVPFVSRNGQKPFRVPVAPGEDVWTERPIAEHLGMQRAAVADVPWEGDLWTKAAWYAVEGDEVLYCSRYSDANWFLEDWGDSLEIWPEGPLDDRGNAHYVPLEALRPLMDFKVRAQADMASYSSENRRPAYWMRGKPVTPEQAQEIIRRTDRFFSGRDHVFVENFDSWWFHPNHFPAMYGWCRPDGRIGLDSITQPYPDAWTLARDAYRLLSAFPFLDFILLIWNTEEELGFRPYELETQGMPQPECGVHIHDNCVEFLCPKTAWERFCLYHRKYGESPVTYLSEYNQEQGENRVSREYLERCCVRGTIPEYRPDEFKPLPGRTGKPDFDVENLRYRVLEGSMSN